jgi:triacylglycerol lipase
MMQDHIRRAIAAMPPGIDPELSVQTRELYAPLHKAIQDGVTLDADIAYGAHPRQVVDVRQIPGRRCDGIVIYVPGGGFSGGDKRAFGNVASYLVKAGLLGVTMNYRLLPDFRWPSGAEDVAAAVQWAKANAARYQADPTRIFVFGHSAGASHVATYLFDPDIKGGNIVTGAVLVSGSSYALRKGELRGNVLDYFGADDSRYERQSVVTHVPGTRVPVLLACAERDPGFLVTPSLELAIALTRRDGQSPPLRVLEGHNHFSPPSSLGTDDDELGGAILRFIKGLA